jgi:hypothetical protein
MLSLLDFERFDFFADCDFVGVTVLEPPLDFFADFFADFFNAFFSFLNGNY